MSKSKKQEHEKQKQHMQDCKISTSKNMNIWNNFKAKSTN